MDWKLLSSITPQIRPPLDGKVRVLEAAVPIAATWDQAIAAATRGGLHKDVVYDVGEQYARPGDPERPRQFVLMWAGIGSKVSAQEARCWGEAQSLLPVSPYELFGLMTLYPELYKACHLHTGAGFLATELCTYAGMQRACGVWQSARGSARASVIESCQRFFDRTLFVFNLP